jgi:hypothetical protein
MTSIDSASQRYSIASNMNPHANSGKKQQFSSRLSAPPTMYFPDSEENKSDRLVLNQFTLYETKTVNYQFVNFNI